MLADDLAAFSRQVPDDHPLSGEEEIGRLSGRGPPRALSSVARPG